MLPFSSSPPDIVPFDTLKRNALARTNYSRATVVCLLGETVQREVSLYFCINSYRETAIFEGKVGHMLIECEIDPLKSKC